MQKKYWFVLVSVIAILAVAVFPVGAVQYGEPDGNGHPYVGLVVFHNADGFPLWRCTGALVSQTVFLTAGHCAEDFSTAKAVIWFDPGPIPLGTWTPGQSCAGQTGYPCTGDATGMPYSHPNWTGGLTLPNTHDVGVVVLDAPFSMSEYGQLAPAGHLDSLATQRGLQNVEFTVVGYGLQLVKPVTMGVRERYVGTVSLINLGSALTDGFNVHFSSNPGKGHGGSGGVCFGDSGGPVFHDGMIVAVNSFVLNSNCKGAGFGYRVDTSVSRDFLDDFVALP